MPADLKRLRIFDDTEELSRAAARRFVEMAADAVESSGSFSVALAGGSTPKRIYELLAGDELREQVAWPKCHIFFGDERCVPPDHADSNYRMANETLLSRVPVPSENVHRIAGEGDAKANARAYEDELRGFFGKRAWPEFDLIMLGMGDDGHTASLFPHTDALKETEAWVAANWVGKFDAFRITLTAPAINHARAILFVVAGAGKAARLSEVVEGPREPERLPAQLIAPAEGVLEWFVDGEAASALRGS